MRGVLLWGGYMVLVILLTLAVSHTQAEPAPYQVYKISFGCLYVVTTQGGGVSTEVTPSVNGMCK